MILDPSYILIKKLYQAHEYSWEQVNIFAFRSKDATVDKWNDVIGVAFEGKVFCVSGTTDPGASPLLKTEGVNKDGIFILKPGFYKNCWHRGLHKGKYRALVQFGMGVFKGWRDADKDGKLDFAGKEWDNVSGLNLHTTRWDKQVMRVGDFSEACQVVEVAKEYDDFMEIIYSSKQIMFSYALFDE